MTSSSSSELLLDGVAERRTLPESVGRMLENIGQRLADLRVLAKDTGADEKVIVAIRDVGDVLDRERNDFVSAILENTEHDPAVASRQ